MTSPSMTPDWMGRFIGHQKRYRIEDTLGSGGMGTVFLAKDVLLGKTVALKLLKATLSDDNAFRQRFEREVSVCAALASEHIVRIDDYGITEEGYPYFVMERLMGETLAQRLSYKGVLSIDASTSIISQVCLGLQTAHRGVSLWVKGEATEPIKIIHRDLKPENIFLVPTGLGDLVKILDFGIAKISSDNQNEQAAGLTGTDMFIGTFDYASPEQVSGHRHIDERSDIYSLGMILYRMLSGTDPFGLGRTGQRTSGINWAVAHATKTPESLRGQPNCVSLPDPLEQIVMRCIAKAPEERFTSVDELRQSLLDFAASRACPDSAPPSSSPTVVREFPAAPAEPPSRTSVEVPALNGRMNGSNSSGTVIDPSRISAPGNSPASPPVPAAPLSSAPISPQVQVQPAATVMAVSQNQPVAAPPVELPIDQPTSEPISETAVVAPADLLELEDRGTNGAPMSSATSMEVPVLTPPVADSEPGASINGRTSVEIPRLAEVASPPQPSTPELAETSIARPPTSETQVVAPSLSRSVAPPTAEPPVEPAVGLPGRSTFVPEPQQPAKAPSPKRSLPLPLLAGGGLLLVTLLGGAGWGFWQWSQSQAANQRLADIRQFKASSNFEQCVNTATGFSGPDTAVTEANTLLNSCRLGSAKALAGDKKFAEALAAIAVIPSGDSSFNEAKTLIDGWSTQLISQATELYNTKGDTDAAVTLLGNIPNTSSVFAKTQDLTTKWKDDTTHNRQALKLAQAALTQGRWQAALTEAEKMRATTPYWKEQQRIITSKANTELDKVAAEQRRQDEQRRLAEQREWERNNPPAPAPQPYNPPAQQPVYNDPPPRRSDPPPPRRSSGGGGGSDTGDLCSGQGNFCSN
jgi:serine/threonine protein kinase